MRVSEESLGTMAGFGAGILNALAVGPLDVVKARQQVQKRLLSERAATQAQIKYTGTLHSLKTIFREEGVRGFYRGIGPTLVGYAPTWAIYFSVYNRGRKTLSEHFPHCSTSLIVMVSAVVSGGVSNVISNPIWVIRARLQTQEHVLCAKPEFEGAMDCARKMYRREGVLSFYKGLAPATLTLIHVAIQFPLYEALKREFLIEEHPEVFSFDHAMRLVACSSASKLVASVMTYPLEVVRTRMQVQRTDLAENGKLHYATVFGSFRTIAREEGWSGLYSGIRTNLIRVVPACAITFTSYELLYRKLKLWNV